MRKNRLFASAALATLALAASSALAATYTTEASFLAAIQPNPYIENFSSFTFGAPLDGTQTTYNAPGGNGYGWTASAPLGLYSNNSAISTNTAFDPLTFTFTGAPVTAIGGNITNTNISGAVIPGNVDIVLSNGQTFTVVNQTLSSFWGWTSDTNVPIVSVTFDTQTSATNGWPQVDHFYSATAVVPEPAVGGVLMAAVGLVAARRRRS